ncbi:MAG: TonB family protein [Hyphomicrobiaceae bacterium]
MSFAFESSVLSVGRSVLALVCGLLIHGVAVVAMLQAAPIDEQPDDVSGPIAIELAPLPVAPPVPQRDLPAGPLAQESQQSPPVTPTQAEVAKAEEAPPLPTTPYEPDDPDLQMAKASPKKDNEETPTNDKTTEAIQSPPTPPSTLVRETTAPPPMALPPAPVAAAPEAGLSEKDRRTIARWQRQLVMHLNRFKRYPPAARGKGVQGDVRLTFRIDRSGAVLGARVATASGSPLLDTAALRILVEAGGLPPPPPQVPGDDIELTLPIQYRMKE